MRSSKRSWRGWAILLLLGGGVGAYYRFMERPQPISSDSVRRPVLASLVFRNENQSADMDFLADAFTHDTIAKIGQLCSDGFDIIAYDSVATYRDTRKSLHQIGSELEVDYILEGGVRRNEASVHVTAQLTRVSDQAKLWTFDADRTFGEASEMQKDLIEKIANSLGVVIHPAAVEAMNRATTTNSIAREAFLHSFENCESTAPKALEECVASLEKALQADPEYPRAHVRLAKAQLLLKGKYDAAEGHVLQALRKTDAIPEGHVLLAEILYKWHGDDRQADAEFRKAIELNQSESDAYLSYAEFLLQKNRLDEAQAQIARALALDPFRVAVNVMAGRILTAAKSYDRAIERLGNTISLDRSSPEIRFYLGQAYLARGMYDDAIREFERAVSFGPGVPEYAAALEQARQEARRAGRS